VVGHHLNRLDAWYCRVRPERRGSGAEGFPEPTTPTPAASDIYRSICMRPSAGTGSPRYATALKNV
jgi:hypothetical protein